MTTPEIGDKIRYTKSDKYRNLGFGIIVEKDEKYFSIRYGKIKKTFLIESLSNCEVFDSTNREHYHSEKENLAFKLHYNDNSYRKKCSPEIIKYNKKNTTTGWCSIAPCWKKEYPCNESYLFLDYEADSGETHHWSDGRVKPEELRKGIHIKYAQKGKMAFFTTRKPDTEEKDRYIFGFFLIKDISDPLKEGNKNETTVIYGDKEKSLLFDEKVKVPFWKFYKNKDGSKKMGHGLCRYLDDRQVLAILNHTLGIYEKLKPVNTRIRHDIDIIKEHIGNYQRAVSNT